METLHLELKVDIFSRLPAESILECKLVCKPWLKLLNNDPLFPQMHLHRRLSTLQLHDVPNEEDFGQSQTISGGFELGFIYLKDLVGNKRGSSQLWYGKYGKNDEDEHPFREVKRINLPNVTEGPNRWNQWNPVIGSCNGLICFSIPHHGIEDPIYICNPITREFVNLPRFVTRDENYWSTMVGGFGYNPSTNEYKVVRIFYPNYRQEPQLGRVQVYTLGDGNGWRDKGEITYSISLRQRGILVNEELHWLVDERKIVAFNLALEEFHLTASPPIPDGVFDQRRLCVMGRWLCVSDYFKTGGVWQVDMWLLKKKTSSTSYDDMNGQEYQRGGWIKEFTTPIDHPIDPLGLTKRGEILFMKPVSCFLCIYDLKTATVEELEELDYFSQTAIPHINSFVSLKALGEKCRRRKKNYV